MLRHGSGQVGASQDHGFQQGQARRDRNAAWLPEARTMREHGPELSYSGRIAPKRVGRPEVVPRVPPVLAAGLALVAVTTNRPGSRSTSRMITNIRSRPHSEHVASGLHPAGVPSRAGQGDLTADGR